VRDDLPTIAELEALRRHRPEVYEAIRQLVAALLAESRANSPVVKIIHRKP
jgi:hypothetical protein